MYFLLSLLGGSLYAFGFPSKILPTNVIFPILGFSLLFFSYINSKESWKKCLLHAIIFSIGFNFTGFYWVAHTLQEFGELPVIVSWLLSSFFSIIILPQHTLGVLIYFLAKKKFDFNKISFELKVFLTAVFFATLEQVIPQQFPAHIGHGWLEHTSMLGMAPIFGATFYSFINYWIALTILSFVIKKKHILSSAIIVVLLLLTFTPLGLEKEKRNELNIRILQANIGNYLKLSSERGELDSVEKVLSYYKKIGTEKTTKKLDLIIMPETAFPFSMDTLKMEQKIFAAPFLIQDITSAQNASLLTGGYDVNNTMEAGPLAGEFNSAFLFNERAEVQTVYHKNILIPFGETLPFGPLNELLAPLAKNVSFFGRGSTLDVFTVKGSQFITPICYEILSTSFTRKYLNASKEKVDYIVNLTNDSWYGDTAEPWQHKFLAHWRAVEFQIPIIRSTNTGLTSVLFPDGSESKRLGVGKMGYLELTINSNQTKTSIYQDWGYLLILGLWLILGTLIFFTEPFFEKFMNSNKS